MIARRSSRRTVRYSLLVSFALHLAAIVVLAALLQPAGYGPVRPFELNASLTDPLPDPEMVVIADSTIPLNAGERLTDDVSEVFSHSGEATDYVSLEKLGTARRAGSGTDDATSRGSGTGASFFGTAASGDRFVYIVDISTSMDAGNRIGRAIDELKASVERLSPSQSFYVILFCGHTRRMLDDGSVFPQSLPATPENKRRLHDWLATVTTDEWTDPREALRLGFNMRPSALFLLSDGQFNGEEKQLNVGLLNGNPSVSEVIDRHNRFATPVHTIAYEEKASCLGMEQIARSTGGQYRFIAKVSDPAATAELLENRANYLLSRAQTFESRGRWKQALAIYRRIERDFPASDAAATAATKTTQISARAQ